MLLRLQSIINNLNNILDGIKAKLRFQSLFAPNSLLGYKKAGLLTHESEQKRLPKNMLSNSFQWPLLLFFSITVTRIVPEFHEIPFFQQGYLSSVPCSKTLTGKCYNFEYQLARKKIY